MIKLPPDHRSPSSPSGAAPGKSAAPAPKDAESTRLLVDAEAFLRLGLVDKAIAHLSNALDRDPSLRTLRKPLLTLYVARRKYKDAVRELRSLLTTCSDPQEEIRYLRYLLRLGEQDAAAEARLQSLLLQQPQDPAHISAEFVQPDTAETSLEGELRDYLSRHRPPTDLMQTQALSADEAQSQLDRLHELAAITSPDIGKIEEVAEEMAYHNGTLKDELDAFDHQLRSQNYDAARSLLRDLCERYPHSKRVQAKLGELLSRPAEPQVGPASAPDAKKPEPAHPERKSRRKGHATRATQPADVNDEIGGSTLEVDPNDIKEERPAQAARPVPPPPPSSFPGTGQEGGIPRAYALASTLRVAGKFEQAMVLYHQVSSDPTYGVSAVRMIGLCLRDLDRLDDAILTLTKAVNLPQANERELSELFYELGATYELLNNSAEAILYYQLSLGSRGSFRDATQRIAELQDSMLTP